MTDSVAEREDTANGGNDIASAAMANDFLTKQLALLEEEIALERRQPWKPLADYLAFHILTGLSRLSPPLPIKIASRFSNSAKKRAPNRTLAQREGSIDSGPVPEPVRRLYAGKKTTDHKKKNVLIVSHEASLSGAPILALNLVQNLSERYNVTVLSLRSGKLVENFQLPSVAVYVTDGLGPQGVRKVIARLCREQSFAFAVMNSAEARSVLGPLRSEGVPTISLVHEFASYVRQSSWKKSAFEEIFDGSNEVVFSTRLTLQSAQEKNPRVNMSAAHVLPQGKCNAPRNARAGSNSDDEKARLQTAFRPAAAKEKRIVIIGAGTVQFRKGVDLFIEAATRVLTSPGGENAHFFWIGPQYNPEKDLVYSVYLEDQLRRAGVADRVVMLSETTEIELAYSLADIFVLSSRLDPLPNVTIDALSVGLPVICFENASGTADLLIEAGLKDACVASYIDTSDMADKILALVKDPSLRADVAAQSRVFAGKTFDFDAYARRIEALGLNAAAGKN